MQQSDGDEEIEGEFYMEDLQNQHYGKQRNDLPFL